MPKRHALELTCFCGARGPGAVSIPRRVDEDGWELTAAAVEALPEFDVLGDGAIGADECEAVSEDAGTDRDEQQGNDHERCHGAT